MTARDCSPLRPPAAACAVAAVLVVLAGCDGGNEAMSGRPPAAGEHTALKGIPVPQGFRIDPKHSNAWESGQVRFANCQFEGPGRIDGIAEFYIQYMPAAKFTLKRRQLVAGEWLLDFQSDAEAAAVRVTPKGDRSVVSIELGPLPRGSAERESKPPVKQQPAREP